MKTILTSILISLFCLPLLLSAQTGADSTGFAGDNFSLEGALQLLKESNTLEDFEKKLNNESNYVNNLDLNEDGDIDYVKVNDNTEEGLHAIALQVDVSQNETQDIAVILIEKTGNENAILQIIGDEDVFGEETIIEPYSESMEAGGKGNAEITFGNTRIIVNVWSWPSVRYVYAPGYVVYRSPWKWHYYPNWWRPWRPHPWRWHYNKRTVYHVHFKPFHTHRVIRAHTFYKPKRKTSVTVRTKTVKTRTVVKTNKKGRKSGIKKTTIKKTSTTKHTVGKGPKATKKKTTVEKKSAVKKTNKGTVKKKKKTKKTTRTKKRK